MSEANIATKTDTISRKDVVHLCDHINKIISLPDFLEANGCDIRWSRNETSGVCLCPLPNHQENTPSFRINLMDEEVWIFHCFGCGKSGNFVRFWQEYYNISDRLEAVRQICAKYDIKNTEELIIKNILSTNKKVDILRKLENENLVISNLGRMLLQKDKENIKFVYDRYEKINNAINNADEEAIAKISFEFTQKLR